MSKLPTFLLGKYCAIIQKSLKKVVFYPYKTYICTSEIINEHKKITN